MFLSGDVVMFNFRDVNVAAPLKEFGGRPKYAMQANFRDVNVAAPLKAGILYRLLESGMIFPRR